MQSFIKTSQFQLIGTDGITEVGAIYKKYRGPLHEATSSTDAFLLKGEHLLYE